ncbi:hypothetical protein BLJAPNOD_02377 [Ensifer sp. M14]|uniref:hypothetical protein n=1 Tax=Ensifer sp. M14 TaxID=2203782 RepID=UPI000E2B4BD6|nr:hypothetical protein [Ensifer sp. M14]RDL51245.1 hypothetical protein BLJAPNOD_02377 [Ensifer sp. M14]
MPRTGGVYTPPAGTKGVPNTTIQSVPYNTLIDDLAADANAPRPVTAGGTGATSASAARTALGVEIGTNVQAYDAGLQSIAGLVTVVDQMIYTTALDAYATTALTPFARTLLDDVDAATARATLGANNASNLTTGTIADARLPATMTAKTFTGQITGTSLGMSGDIVTTGSNFYINSNGNKHFWFRTAIGINRALLYNEVTDNSLRLNLYNTSGVFVRALQFRESDGLLQIDGPIQTTGITVNGDITATRGNGTGVVFLGGGSRYLHYDGSKYVMPAAHLQVGSATYQTDGNVVFAGGMLSFGVDLYNALLNKVTVNTGDAGSARFLKMNGAAGGTNMQFNWNGQAGQPAWIWGGDASSTGTQMYVYNPSNFNVNYANGAGNADTVDGYHATDLAQIYKGSNSGETNFPLGTVLAVTVGSGEGARNQASTLKIWSSSTAQYVTAALGGTGATLSGTWRCRGMTSYAGSEVLFQRVA